MSPYADAPESTKVEKTSPIDEFIKELEGNIDRFDQELEVLLKKLEPILNSTQTGDNPDSQEQRQVFSPLAKSLQEITTNQRRQIRRLKSISYDIEL